MAQRDLDASGVLHFSGEGEAYLDAAFQRRGNSAQHGKRMPFLIRIFKPRNYGLGGANFAGQLRLRQFRAGSQLINLPRDIQVGSFLLKQIGHFGATPGKPVNELHRIAGWFSLLATHFEYLLSL